jgi:hypothetical protein
VGALDGLAAACLGPAPEGEGAAVAEAAAAQDSLREWVLALRRCPVAPAPPAAMAAWLEALLPSDGAARSARRLALTLARRAGHPTPPPAAARPVTAERPALTPPPLPAGLTTVAAAAVAPEASPPAPRPQPGSEPQSQPEPQPQSGHQSQSRSQPEPHGTWLDHPAAPISAGVAMALLGLALGLWLGR